MRLDKLIARSRPIHRSAWLAAVLCHATLLTAPAFAAEAKPIRFNRDIRPILSDNCFTCHGPDAGERAGELRLDERADAVRDRDGYAVIVPGKPDESELMHALLSDDKTERMPPPKTNKTLTREQIDLLRRWIAQGAPYEKHWSFEPVKREPAPAVKQTDWPINAIDRYVLARLEAKGIKPSPPADRHTLIRRVTLDLIGLAPEPARVEAFIHDKRPDAYEQLVDELLTSEHFGERWGRHWLDHARYADSHGYTGDQARTMWPWRDWVIQAINRDMPFDRFTIEQLAGDMLPGASDAQVLATGFHRNTLINTEGGTKPDQFRYEATIDRTNTTGQVWLGLTVACAQCHTHKYDPITQTEYYQLFAFFNSAQDRNSVSPTITMDSASQRAEIAAIDSKIKAIQAEAAAADKTASQRRASWEASLAKQHDGKPATWTRVAIDAKSRHGAKFSQLPDASLLVSGANKAADVYTVTFTTELATVASIQFEALTHPTLPRKGPGRASNGNFVMSRIWLEDAAGKKHLFSRALADHSQKGYHVKAAIDGSPATGWAINGAPGGLNNNRVAVFGLAQPIASAKGQPLKLVAEFNNKTSLYNLGRFRVSVSAQQAGLSKDDRSLAAIAAKPATQRSAGERKTLDAAWRQQDPEARRRDAEIKQLTAQRDRLRRKAPTSMVMRELSKPRTTHLHTRGDFTRPDKVVKPDVPGVLPPLPTREGDALATRLDLARWLVRKDNPLTPRVQMNRVWMRLFGRGLVETEEDFGTQGTLPTHPLLLDHLAGTFMERNWSLKAMIKHIVMSATYRQSSHDRNDLHTIDPRNLLLARQNRVRVEAEIVRDLALSASGLLSKKIGGPSVFPPQPAGVYAFTQVRKSWRVSQGEDRYRRGMYTFFWRSAPHPMLTTFDTPKFNTTCTRRNRSNTPLQALTVANDEAMVEAAQAMAKRVLGQAKGDAERIKTAFVLCFARPPASREASRLASFLAQQRERFADDEAGAKQAVGRHRADGVTMTENAAWVALCRVLINLDAFITRE